MDLSPRILPTTWLIKRELWRAVSERIFILRHFWWIALEFAEMQTINSRRSDADDVYIHTVFVVTPFRLRPCHRVSCYTPLQSSKIHGLLRYEALWVVCLINCYIFYQFFSQSPCIRLSEISIGLPLLVSYLWSQTGRPDRAVCSAFTDASVLRSLFHFSVSIVAPG